MHWIRNNVFSIVVLFWLFAVSGPLAQGAQIGDLMETDWRDQAIRFWTFQDPSVRYAVMGTIFMGISCGLLGSFIVVRKLALVGDTLSHAVLPGVALGFLWNMSKDPFAIFIGATIAGLIGAVVVSLIKQTTHIKEDSALGMVLAGFYAVGICLLTMIQKLDIGSKSGLDKFMFGQAAALSEGDVRIMGIIAGISVLLIILFYKQFLTTSFDPGFARGLGMQVQVFHYLLMLLLAFSIVVSLQATGVVLVSAMLIIPAATAYLLTDRMHYMLLLAVLFGIFSALFGSFFSFLGNDLPTGPFMVIGAAFVFTLAFFLGPRYGLFPRWYRRMSRSSRIQMENTLKAVYHVVEARGDDGRGVTIQELAEKRNEPIAVAELQVKELVKHGFATVESTGASSLLVEGKIIQLNPSGWMRACEIVRNHRLWELYLTNAAQYQVDHVHDDAEKIEHILGEETVRKLERRLNNPKRDPHGKLIPSQEDMEAYLVPDAQPDLATGYRQPT